MSVPRRRAAEQMARSRAERRNGKGKDEQNSSTHSAWVWVETFLKIGVFLAVVMSCWYYYNRDRKFDQHAIARQQDIHGKKFVSVTCSNDYETERKQFPSCAPRFCGRYVTDTLLTRIDAKRLQKIAEKGFAFGGSSGGASILDLHSGALSKGEKFINLSVIAKARGIFKSDDITHYRYVKQRIQASVAEVFQVDYNQLYLTKPTFFSRMDTKEAKTVHDEYWHEHIDKETYGSFIYTGLFYLNDFGYDFGGGRFWFSPKSRNYSSVEPRTARLLMFTSGAENPHRVEKVSWGIRFALTISFTCDPSLAIPDPELPSG